MTQRPETDEFTTHMHRQLTASLRPVAEKAINDAVRPWRRLVRVLSIAYGLLFVASVVQLILWLAAR